MRYCTCLFATVILRCKKIKYKYSVNMFLTCWMKWCECKFSTLDWCLRVIIQRKTPSSSSLFISQQTKDKNLQYVLLLYLIISHINCVDPFGWQGSESCSSSPCRSWTVTSVQQGPPVALSHCQLSLVN